MSVYALAPLAKADIFDIWSYIEKRSDLKFASSFISSPAKPRIRVTDQQALFAADLGMVARGEIEIVDDRQRPPR